MKRSQLAPTPIEANWMKFVWELSLYCSTHFECVFVRPRRQSVKPSTLYLSTSTSVVNAISYSQDVIFFSKHDYSVIESLEVTYHKRWRVTLTIMWQHWPITNYMVTITCDWRLLCCNKLLRPNRIMLWY